MTNRLSKYAATQHIPSPCARVPGNRRSEQPEAGRCVTAHHRVRCFQKSAGTGGRARYHLVGPQSQGPVADPAGEDFHVHASQSMAGFARAVESVHGRSKKRTLLRIGALPTAAASIVPHAVHRMLERYPEVDIDVTSGAFEYLASKLRLGELDLLVGRMISRDTVGFSFERLYEEDVLAIVRSGHPLTRTDVINVESLAAYTVIAPPANSQVRTMVDDFLFASHAHTNLKFIESQSETFSRAYVCQHDTVWFVPAGVVEVDLRLHVLLALPIHSPLLRAPIGMTTMAGSPTSAQGEAFAKVLREIAQEGSNSSRYQAK